MNKVYTYMFMLSISRMIYSCDDMYYMYECDDDIPSVNTYFNTDDIDDMPLPEKAIALAKKFYNETSKEERKNMITTGALIGALKELYLDKENNDNEKALHEAFDIIHPQNTRLFEEYVKQTSFCDSSFLKGIVFWDFIINNIIDQKDDLFDFNENYDKQKTFNIIKALLGYINKENFNKEITSNNYQKKEKTFFIYKLLKKILDNRNMNIYDYFAFIMQQYCLEIYKKYESYIDKNRCTPVVLNFLQEQTKQYFEGLSSIANENSDQESMIYKTANYLKSIFLFINTLNSTQKTKEQILKCYNVGFNINENLQTFLLNYSNNINDQKWVQLARVYDCKKGFINKGKNDINITSILCFDDGNEGLLGSLFSTQINTYIRPQYRDFIQLPKKYKLTNDGYTCEIDNHKITNGIAHIYVLSTDFYLAIGNFEFLSTQNINYYSLIKNGDNYEKIVVINNGGILSLYKDQVEANIDDYLGNKLLNHNLCITKNITPLGAPKQYPLTIKSGYVFYNYTYYNIDMFDGNYTFDPPLCNFLKAIKINKNDKGEYSASAQELPNYAKLKEITINDYKFKPFKVKDGRILLGLCETELDKKLKEALKKICKTNDMSNPYFNLASDIWNKYVTDLELKKESNWLN